MITSYTTAISFNDAMLYARLCLKQHGLKHYAVKLEKSKTRLGAADCNNKILIINKICLQSFALFDLVVKHEIAHFLQFKANGNKFFVKNGRRSYHGADFKAQCRKLGIPARATLDLKKYKINL